MIIPNIWENIIYVPNHQPDINSWIAHPFSPIFIIHWCLYRIPASKFHVHHVLGERESIGAPNHHDTFVAAPRDAPDALDLCSSPWEFYWLVGQGKNPSEKWWSSSIGMIRNPMYGKIKNGNQLPPTSIAIIFKCWQWESSASNWGRNRWPIALASLSLEFHINTNEKQLKKQSVTKLDEYVVALFHVNISKPQILIFHDLSIAGIAGSTCHEKSPSHLDQLVGCLQLLPMMIRAQCAKSMVHWRSAQRSGSQHHVMGWKPSISLWMNCKSPSYCFGCEDQATWNTSEYIGKHMENMENIVSLQESRCKASA